MIRTFAMALSACAAALLPVGPATAQDAAPEAEHCPRYFAWDSPAPLAVVPIPASLQVAQVGGEVALTFVGHSTFLIESPAGVTIATDYNDSIRPAGTPTVATMNRAHISHYSIAPDPGIAHLLPGWGEDGVPAAYDLTVDDVWIRNVTTNIRFGFDELGPTVLRDMNSIFVFEVAGLCIAHLGHLHHTLTPDHLDALGRIDVVLAPVDGSRTLSVAGMLEVLRDIQAPLVIPMHFFGASTMARFAEGLEGFYTTEISDGSSILLSRDNLPQVPTLLVLRPSF